MADEKNAGSTPSGNSANLAVVEFTPSARYSETEQVAIYAGKDAVLIATTGAKGNQAAEERARRLVKDADFKQLVEKRVPEAKEALGVGSHVDGQGGVSLPEKMVALSRPGSKAEPEVVIVDYGKDRGQDFAKELADNVAVQRTLSQPLEKRDAREPANKDFRQMTQAERLQDKSTNAAAKQVAAIDAVIDQKYGSATPEAARMKAAAREAVAQTLERGGQVPTPRVRETEQRREETREQHRAAADKIAKDLER